MSNHLPPKRYEFAHNSQGKTIFTATNHRSVRSIFQTEKQLKEIGDKLPADKKAQIEAALAKLKDAHKAQDLAGIDTATNELNTVFQAASQDLYNTQTQAGEDPNQGAGASSATGNTTKDKDDNVTDVDFEEVK